MNSKCKRVWDEAVMKHKDKKRMEIFPTFRGSIKYFVFKIMARYLKEKGKH